MAVVRFSRKLKQEVLNSAQRMFSLRMTTLRDSFECDYGDRMYDKAFGAWETAAAKLPEGWLKTASGIEVNCVTDGDAHIHLRPSRSFNFTTGRVSPMVDSVAASNGKLRKYGYGSAFTYVVSPSDPEDAEFWKRLVEWRDKCLELERQQTEFHNSVTKIMDRFTTLAPALKAWPPLWDLLPEWAKERHKEIVERKKHDPAEDLDVDLNKMTSVVTINKLTGGS